MRYLLFLCLWLSVSAYAAHHETNLQDSASDYGKELMSYFIGRWEGTGQEGRFKEVTEYRWGPGENHLLLDMKFYFDDELNGEASGFFAYDQDQQALLFHMVSSTGVVIHQRQISQQGHHFRLHATTHNGAAVNFPPEFQTELHLKDMQHYDSSVWMLMDDGENKEWQKVMTNQFTKIEG